MSDKHLEKRKPGIIITNNKIIITIPPIINDSMKCLKTTSTNDVTAAHNVMLFNNKNQRLYVDNLMDFREVLKQFYIYKKLCTVIQKAMKASKMKFMSENSKCVEVVQYASADKIPLSGVSKEQTTNSKISIQKEISAFKSDETPEASISVELPLKASFIDSETSYHDNINLIACNHANESTQCATVRDAPCPASCSHGLYLETLPEGKRLLRKKGCCAVI